jgi:enoyl-CoA hydratase/3-hydroxyacyl-CoA dehydrogenase
MKKIGIIGAGHMGNGIAQKTAQEGLFVVMVDIKEEFVERGMNTIRSTLEEGVKRQILRPEQVEDIMGRIVGTTNLKDVADCDLVIEAVFEDMGVKNELFSNLDRICGEKTILATNTSTFSVDELSQSTNRADRFVGLHFFYHPAKNRLLEIIPGPRTSTETLKAAQKYSKLSGKIDLLAKDAPGFVVNRYFTSLNNEAFRILEEGIANIPTIDHAAKELLGVGMGPFLLVNVTGVPLALHTQAVLHERLGSFYKPAAILVKQVESGLDWPLEGDVEKEKVAAVCDRLMGSIFYNASSLLEEDVTDMLGVNIGAKVGLRWRKGPFELMNEVGIDRAYELVDKILKPYSDVKIPDILTAQKAKGEPWSST